jgi:hypothetical protein
VQTRPSETPSPVNPLVSFRETLKLTPSELAAHTGVSVVIIEMQEKGIPHHLHPRFLQKFPASVELIPSYYEFRKERRRANFPPAESVVPETGPEFAQWLRGRGLTVGEFSEKACLPVVDISYALHHFRLTSTIRRFFEEINE